MLRGIRPQRPFTVMDARESLCPIYNESYRGRKGGTGQKLAEAIVSYRLMFQYI
jgi:hypothetical protein